MTFLVSLLLSVSISHAKTECIGPQKAGTYFVYLHGSHAVGGSRLKEWNKEVLKQLAGKHSIRFALPDAALHCNDDETRSCWMTGKEWDRASDALKDTIEEAARDCFPREKFGLVGFSNGGYFVDNLIKTCARNDYTRLISVGAGGTQRPEDPKTLDGCKPKLTMLVGDSDSTYGASAKQFFENLKKLHADVELKTYSGEHRLYLEALEQAL
jgi:predicted esterase